MNKVILVSMGKRFIKVVLFFPAILIKIALFVVEVFYFAVSCPVAYILFDDIFKFDIGRKPWHKLFFDWYKNL